MATYNWSYRPNISNRYGIDIEVTADNVKPWNICYVGLFGNDQLGNGSRMKPYKTLTKAISTCNNGDYVIIGAGVYRESIQDVVFNKGSIKLVGDGDVTIDYSYYINSGFCGSGCGGWALYNLKMIGNNQPILKTGGADGPASCYDCVLDGTYNFGYAATGGGNLINCILKNYSNADYPAAFIRDSYSVLNTTIINCKSVYIYPTIKEVTSSIFVGCEVSFQGGVNQKPRYSLFWNCLFDGTAISTTQELLDHYLGLYPGFTNGLKGCIIADPKFNNFPIGDYSLQFDSPAKNLSYFGTYVGAQSIAYAVKASAVEADGGFDFSTAVNIDIADNSITIVDANSFASIETKVISNLIQRELGKAPIYGFNADRNGQYIDSIADLAPTTIAVGTNLAANTPYIVEVSAIVNNGQTIQPGERFTTGSDISFTSSGGGVCREIIEAPQRHTIMARFSDVEAELITKPYQHYEPGIKFTSNNVGDSRTGEIVRGNGDPLYERGAGKEFAINARFIQVKYIIQPNNLKP